MRFAVDTGGTFTDLIVESDTGSLHMFKAPTTPDDPVCGVLESLTRAAEAFHLPLNELLGRGTLFVHGTTHAINAIITGKTARTAFLTTEGHRDVLALREGGRMEPFNFTVPYPEPYVPLTLSFEVPGRILADGSVLRPFDDVAAQRIIETLRSQKVEAVAVCLLWSIINSAHEQRLGELLDECLPGIPYTLSHRLNPSLREYRRASSTAIDASLKPLMQAYMAQLTGRLGEAGFSGRVLIVTSQGGVMDAAEVAEAPIHLVNSGPSMAPVSGRYFAKVDENADTVIVADTGGTTFDVSLVRDGKIPWTRETWIGQPYRGHMTGFPSVDVKSIGAGGGSIAWIDDGGLLHVGPASAGAVPGPACYGKGGTDVTVTDAALVLGYVDPGFFLGGAIKLDTNAARAAVASRVSEPLGITVEDAALAVISIATENMVQAIVDITVAQGIDPRAAVLLGGGGAAGLNAAEIGRRLGCQHVIIPEVGAGLSAAGAMMSDLTAQWRQTFFASSDSFDFTRVNAVLDALEARCQAFIDGPGKGSLKQSVELFAEARYRDQVWEIEVKLPTRRFTGQRDLASFVENFHSVHESVFAVRDPGSAVEVVSWAANVRCQLRASETGSLARDEVIASVDGARQVFFDGAGWLEAATRRFEKIEPTEIVRGPAIIESPFTSIVLTPGSSAQKRMSGSLSIRPAGAPERRIGT